MEEACGTCVGKRGALRGLGEGHLKEIDHLKDSRRWEDSIKMNLEVISIGESG